ncbi:RAI1 like PD-XK nuclease-domain-containing protein [Cunninghamella echinulata]|nr:RAI1 like PD-XK nuclease-domain-containing protein [Cunninghamella echinulata]
MSKRKLSTDGAYINNKRSIINHLPVYNINKYRGSSPVYKQPVEINSYSIDENRRIWFDNRELKYYYPATGTDLSIGYDRFIQRDDSILEHLDTLLDAITDANNKIKDTNLTKANIITWRGIMTKILCTPYCRTEPWELRATKYKDSIFIEEQTTQLKKDQEANASVRQQLMCYWGYKFETLSTISKPPASIQQDDDQEIQDRVHETANTNVQYCVVVKTSLGNNSIIMGAEVDCTKDEKIKHDPLKNYIELKTSRILENPKQIKSFERFKLLKFWAQSFLVGVPKIIVGFRNDDGHIKKIQEFKTLEIPRLVRNQGYWDPSVCLNFADQVLNWLQKNIIDNDPTITYSIKWQQPWDKLTLEYTGHDNVFLTQRFKEGNISHDVGGPRIDHI